LREEGIHARVAADGAGDGTAWTPSTLDPGLTFSAIWGASAKDIWVVGGSSNALHYNGSAWSATQFSGGVHSANSLWGTK
jgi:hypothetical protein